MAITNFIPTIWSENLLTSLDKKYIGVAHCNRDYEGDILGKGSSVKICGVGNITIGNYTKNTDMKTPQDLSDTVAELVIDQAKYFNFQVDDIDRAQSNPKLLDAAMKNAARALADEADKYVYSLFEEAGRTMNYDLTDTSTFSIIDALIRAREHLYKNGVTNSEEIVVELTPRVATALLMEQTDVLSNNNSVIETGCIGSIAGCKVYVSNDVYVEGGSLEYHKCLIRTTRAIAFAEQLSEIEAYRPEKRFADAVKGLHLYGAKVVYPNELVCLSISMNEDA